MTIPSALTLLVNLFPDPIEQAQAIGAFGGSGGVGNGELSSHRRVTMGSLLLLVLGLLVGAIFAKLASWRWIFWFITMLALPMAVIAALFLPPQTEVVDPSLDRRPSWLQKLNSLDLGGISLLTGKSAVCLLSEASS